jgi:hypothetical protein
MFGLEQRVERGAATAPPASPLTSWSPGSLRRLGGFWARLGAAATLTAIAYAPDGVHLLDVAMAGSRTAYLLVLPVLMLMIAGGYRHPVRGVADAETDWILALLVGVAGFAALRALDHRLPTLATFWGLHQLGAVLWFACAIAVMFGARQVVRMWPLWIFAACCATPLPYLLSVAEWGGSDATAALLTGFIGAVAVFLAGRPCPPLTRTVAAIACAALAVGWVSALGTTVGPLVDIVVVGAALPVLTTLAFFRGRRPSGDDAARASHPHRSPTALAIAAGLAITALVMNMPAAARVSIGQAPVNWVERTNLGTPTTYDFIADYLGAGSTLHRYLVPPTATRPAAAIDVVATPNRAALDDYADAVWYPTPRPVNYHPADLGPGMPAGTRTIHSNADAAADSSAPDWYAVTWTWQVADTYQRVTIIVSQSRSAGQPPAPVRLSVTGSVLAPALWIARQQPDTGGEVDPLVTRRAAELVKLVVSATGTTAGASPSA